MRKNKSEAALFARYISEFLHDYAPCFLTHSDHTLRSYRDTINLYIAFLEEEGITPASFGRNTFEKPLIEKWIRWLLSERHSCPDTCNVRLGSLRVFLEFLASKDVSLLYLYHEAKTIKRQKCQKKKVKGLTRDAVSSILDEIDTTSRIGRRDMTLLSLLYGTAARIGEIQSLTMKDLHLNSAKPYVLLHGKGGKTRTAYLLPRMAFNLQGYIAEFHGDQAKPDSHLFYTRVGGKKENMLTEAAIDKRIKKYASLAHEKNPDVSPDTHAHQFRHAKASHWLEDGINVVQIRYLLGHENLETTMKYLDITPSEKAEALATLESEKASTQPKKWKNSDGSLSAFLRLPQ